MKKLRRKAKLTVTPRREIPRVVSETAVHGCDEEDTRALEESQRQWLVA